MIDGHHIDLFVDPLSVFIIQVWLNNLIAIAGMVNTYGELWITNKEIVPCCTHVVATTILLL